MAFIRLLVRGLQAAFASLSLVKSISLLFNHPPAARPTEEPQEMPETEASGAMSRSVSELSASSVTSTKSSTPSDSDMSLCALPDELVAMCYSKLPATDLVSLEFVSRRLRELVSADEVAWRQCAQQAWGDPQNFALMSMAANTAGGWKQLFAAKKAAEKQSAPWNVPSTHEVCALFERKYKRTSFSLCPEVSDSRMYSASSLWASKVASGLHVLQAVRTLH